MSAVLTFFMAPFTWAADLSGDWTLSMWGAGAMESFPISIKSDGDSFSVTANHPAFNEMTGTGTVEGEAVSFNLTSSSMEIAFTGSVSGNNKMEGTRAVVGAAGGPGGGGAPEGAPGGAPPEGAAGGPGGGAPGGAPPGGGQGGAPGGAPPEGAPGDAPPGGGAMAESNENFVAIKN